MLVIGVCNVVGSTIARETDAGVYLHAGPEIGVASTKAFTAQVAVLSMMAISIGVSNGTTSAEEGEELGRALLRIPAAVEQCIAGCSSICKQVALEYWLAENFLFLGRAIHYPVALEGALKLKEISYIHAEGLPAAEMKHGHIALVDNRMPVVVIAQKDAKIFEKIVSNIQEVQARGGRVICVCSEAGDSLQRLCEHVILVPSVHPLLDALITVTRRSIGVRLKHGISFISHVQHRHQRAQPPFSLSPPPALQVVPLQLIAYHIAVKRGSDVDQPRNLAKSVTVE